MSEPIPFSITEILTGLKEVTLDAKGAPTAGTQRVVVYEMPKAKSKDGKQEHLTIRFDTPDEK